MNKSVKPTGMSLRALVAGGLLAGAVGLGFGEGGYGQGGSAGEPGTSVPREEEGVGGAKDPAMTTGAASTAALPPNVAPGWKIRVCSEKTKAQSISFKVSNADDKSAKAGKEKGGYGAGGSAEGTPGSDPSATGTGSGEATGAGGATGMTQETASWTQGEANIINLPETVANIERIRIEATPGQTDMRSEVCVLYNDHVAKKLSFDKRAETTVKMNDNGTCGC